jgi:putative hydrolase of the HAD superfamily
MIDPRRIRAVFFDAAGTLFRVRGSVGAIYAEVMERHGARLPAQTLEARLREFIAAAPAPAFPGAAIEDVPRIERRWWRALVSEVMLPAAPFERFEACFDELFELFRTERGWELVPGARETLDRLAAGGYALGVITNFDSRVRDVLRHLGIAPYFQSVILASEEGTAKPHPDLFRVAMRRFRLSPGEALYVGDDPERDVRGALEVGLHPILIDPDADPRSPGAHRLLSLFELVGLLELHPSVPFADPHP